MIKNIFKIVSESLNVSEEAISLDTVFEDDLGADLLDMAELCFLIEEEFKIELPDKDMFGILTVGELAEYIRLHL